MDINRNNYEAWLLDLLEGRLSSEEARELRAFISLNPDCVVDMDAFQPCTLNAENLSFSGKSALRKEIPDHQCAVTEKDFDLFSIARLEGDLNESQQKEFQKILEGNEQKIKEWLLWEQMKLTAKPMIYQGKDSLKKRVLPTSRIIWISVAAAAAAVVLFFTIFSSDPGVNTVAPLAVETENITETPAGRETLQSTEISEMEEASLKAEEAAQKPVEYQIASESRIARASQPSIPEQQDAREAELAESPIRMAVLEANLFRPSQGVSYDKIESLNLPSEPVYTDQVGEYAYSEDGLKESYQAFLEEKNISLLSIASASVEGINRLSGSDLKLNVARDEEGEVRGFRFRSALISVDSPLKKQKKSR